MSRARVPLTVAFVALVVFAACASPPRTPERRVTVTAATTTATLPETTAELFIAAREARRIEGLSGYRRKIRTRTTGADDWFDQGLSLYWAFNHDEAFRSFAKAAEVDPTCTLCWWGAALSVGPNYNMPMMDHRARVAWDALERAARAAPFAPPVEQSLVSALAVRYPGPRAMDAKERQAHDRAYADAMRQVARAFVDDPDVQALFAEALMILEPWKLWTLDGQPTTNTKEIVSTLERSLERSADHPGLNHLYIHAVEASKNPERALAAAERLPAALPGAGHAVHMPSHIHHRLGRYSEAAQANRLAIEADRRYADTISPRPPPAVYGMYMAHNPQFLAVAAMMLGRSEEAVSAARAGVEAMLPSVAHMPALEMYGALPHVMLAKFSRWDEVLSEPMPDPKWKTASGLAHHARGLAFANTKRLAEASAELESLRSAAADLPLGHLAMNNDASAILAIAALVLDARLTELRGDRATAIVRLEEAVSREDQLAYDEPPDWWAPVRHDLGAALLRGKRAKDAESVHRAELVAHPNDPWALFGLAKALGAQGKAAPAGIARADAHAAWSEADVAPPP